MRPALTADMAAKEFLGAEDLAALFHVEREVAIRVLATGWIGEYLGPPCTPEGIPERRSSPPDRVSTALVRRLLDPKHGRALERVEHRIERMRAHLLK